MSFIGTGFRELALKLKRQRTRIALRHERRLLQKSEINLGREGTEQAANFPELRNEIVALKKLEQEQREVALRIARIDEGIKRIEEERHQIAREQASAIAKPDEVRFAEALPKTRSGKIMRRLLKEIASGAKVTGDTTTLEDFSVLAKLAAPEE